MHCYILLYLTKQHVGSNGKHNQRVTLESVPVRDFRPGLIDLKVTSWENTHEQARARNLHHNMMQQCLTSMHITTAAGQGACSITSEGQLEKAANKLSADEVNTLHPP